MNLRSIARALGGDVRGRQVLAPGPNHRRHDRSLAIKLEPNAPDGFLVCSFAGDDWQLCRDYVRQRLGLPAWEPGDEQNRTIRAEHIPKWDFACRKEEDEMLLNEEDFDRIERATKIWNDATDNLKPIIPYFESRCLELPPGLAGRTLRYHPKTPWRNENTGKTDRIPCLLAAFRSIDTDDVFGIHRIRVDLPLLWPKTERRMMGVVRRCAIKLAPLGPTLGIGEGLETAMAAMQVGVGPCWALGYADAISFFPVLPEIKQLKLLRELDENNANLKACKICARRYRAAPGGPKVDGIMPLTGNDLNDALMHHANEARKAAQR